MEPTIDSVQLSWLWKATSGLGLAFAAICAYVWNRLDERVGRLEEGSAGHTEIAELKADIKRLHEKLDRMQEKLIEVLLART